MATRWKPISPHHAGLLILVVAWSGLTGCLHLGGRPATDALTPAEHLKLGISYEHAGQPELALREYERAAAGPERSRALTCQGNIYTARRQWPEAETRYRAALAADPDNVVALNNLAWQLAQEGRALDEAERLIRHALALQAEPHATYADTLEAVLRRAGAPAPAPGEKRL